VVLASLVGVGLPARDDPTPHVLSALEFRFPKAELQEPKPEKLGLFARDIPADAGVDCGGIRFGHATYPYSAARIHSTDLDCPEALELVRAAHRRKPCKLEGCHQGEFACRGLDAYSQTVEMVCRNKHDQRSQVTWSWFGGY
jgi:hypothetical protein